MNKTTATYFEFFTQVGIIAQLSETMFARRLPDGLHMSHFSLLNNLVRLGDGKTPLALAQAFQVPKGTMTHTLKVLDGRGLIFQEPRAEDKRSKLVFLTDAGREYHGAAIAAMAVGMERLLDLMPVEDVSLLLPGLNAIRKVLDENRDL